MTNDEAIAAVRRGERVAGKYSLHTTTKEPCPGLNHTWRTLFCNDEEDVVECSRCGEQGITRCDFDEEYA